MSQATSTIHQFSEKQPKTVRISTTQHGAVRVNDAHIYMESPDIACIYVDLHSKYAEAPVVGGGCGEPPSLYLTAGENTLYLDEKIPRDSMTVVTFPDYAGWSVFACDGPARYTLSVVLIAPNSKDVTSNET